MNDSHFLQKLSLAAEGGLGASFAPLLFLQVLALSSQSQLSEKLVAPYEVNTVRNQNCFYGKVIVKK